MLRRWLAILALCAPLALLPGLAFAQSAVKVYPTDTTQSSCALTATNTVCQVAMAGKSGAGFLVTSVSSPSGFTIWAEVSYDGSSFYQTTFQDISSGERTYEITTTPAAGMQKAINVGTGVRFVRVRPNAVTSGTVTVLVSATDTFPSPSNPAVDAAWYTSGVVTGTTLTQAIAAPASGVSILIWGVVMSASVAATTTTDQQLRLKYGTGTNCGTGTGTIVECFNIANGGCVMNFPVPIKVTAANAVCYMDAATGSKSFNILYSLSK